MVKKKIKVANADAILHNYSQGTFVHTEIKCTLKLKDVKS